MQIEVFTTLGGTTHATEVLLHTEPWPEDASPPLNLKGTFLHPPPGVLPNITFSLWFGTGNHYYRGVMNGGADFELLRMITDN